MTPTEQESGMKERPMAVTDLTAMPVVPALKEKEDEENNPDTQPSQQQAPVNFSKSDSKAMGFVGRSKDMFSGRKLVSTVMTLGFLFTWSERVLTYFRTGLSLYRDAPAMVTGRNLEGGRTGMLKSAAQNTKNLFVKGTDNNFLQQYTTGEKIEALATIGGVSQNLWFLFSSREGDIPEGDTVWQRVKHSFQDPQHHVAQVASMWMTVAVGMVSVGRMLIGIDNLSRDASGGKIGFNPHTALQGLDRISKVEKLMPLVAGAALFISTPLNIYGLMSIKKPKLSKDISSDEKERVILAQETSGSGNIPVAGDDKDDTHIKPFARSKSEAQTSGLKGMLTMLSPGNLKSMIGYATEHDPIGLTGRILAFALDIGSFGVGLARLKQIESGNFAHKFGEMNSPQWNKAHALAKQTRNVGILGFALTGLYSIYVYDTVMRAYKKEQEALKSDKSGKAGSSDNAPQMAR